MVEIDVSKYNMLLDQTYETRLGKVAKVVGLTIESIGPTAKLNDLCHIITERVPIRSSMQKSLVFVTIVCF